MSTLLAATSGDVTKAGKAIGLALGVGLGALGAGVGIGNIFGSMIQSVARQPELRGELQGLMWLGFALTEAVVFYGFLGGLTFWIAAFISLPIGILFYVFEVVIVVTIQAFIFAALSAIYIGSAIEPEH